jgi:AcrR family transcriptional regulator
MRSKGRTSPAKPSSTVLLGAEDLGPGGEHRSDDAGDDALGRSLRIMPRQARGRAKVERMLEAAEWLAATEGVEAITTSRVAERAGVSIGSVYRYLPNREALIEALAARFLRVLEAQMDELADLAGRADLEDPVGLAMGVFADFYRRHPGFRALWLERPLTEPLRELDRRHKRVMAAGIRRALVATGIWSPEEATDAAALAIQLAADAAIQEAFRCDPDGDSALLDAAASLLRRALGLPPKRSSP